MIYPEYLNAAKRHYHTCNVLINIIDSMTDEPKSSDVIKLEKNIYYLLGYVIECSLKYKICELAGYDDSSPVNKDGCTSVGLNFHRDIRIHDLGKLQNVLDSLIADISYYSSCSDLNDVMNNWSPDARYYFENVDYGIIKMFHSHCENFLKKI
ncbi:MAG: hypothetical protein CMB97_08390 [Flavobacteriaceae bacterium]|nr:hypothetical protein [Flavobacteriaceae bacterium]